MTQQGGFSEGQPLLSIPKPEQKMRMIKERKVSRTKEYAQRLEEERLCLSLAKHRAW